VCAAHQDPLDARRPTGMPLRLTAADRLARLSAPPAGHGSRSACA